MTLQGVGRALLFCVLMFSSGCMLFLMKYEGVEQPPDTGAAQSPNESDGDVDTDDTGQADDPGPVDSGRPSDSGVSEDSGVGEPPTLDTGTSTETDGSTDTGTATDTDSGDGEPPVCHDTGSASD
jgi:hypothetical protein